MTRFSRSLTILGGLVLALSLVPMPAITQEQPRSGGELVYVVAAEPPSFDGHREETFAMLHPTGPHYSTLMRVDPTDRTGTKFIGDLAESWTISPDRKTHTFKVRQGGEVPRREPDDVAGRESILRPHHLPGTRQGIEP